MSTAPSTKGTTKSLNIPNPNLPSKDKTPSEAGSTAASKKADESAAAIAQNDPAKAIEKLETRTKAVNANNIARVANSQLTSSDEKLLPLVSLKTGKPLENFPTTSKGLEKLNLVHIDQFLTALEAERSGGEAKRRETLRVQIGLKASPA
ncbi:hypothetical protein LTR95_002950 [Oleoguttula sp. CCFEE 5521]